MAVTSRRCIHRVKRWRGHLGLAHEVFLLLETKDKTLTQIYPAAVLGNKSLRIHPYPQRQGIEVLPGEKDISWVVPATSVALGALELQTLIIERGNHRQ